MLTKKKLSEIEHKLVKYYGVTQVRIVGIRYFDSPNYDAVLRYIYSNASWDMKTHSSKINELIQLYESFKKERNIKDFYIDNVANYLREMPPSI